MSHHGHSVQRRLTIEEDDVAIHQVAMDDITRVEDNFARIDVSQRNHAPITLHERLRTRVLIRAILNVLVELLDIVLGDSLRDGQVHRNLQGHTELADTDIWVRSDN